MWFLSKYKSESRGRFLRIMEDRWRVARTYTRTFSVISVIISNKLLCLLFQYSTTRVTDTATLDENMPFISVQTQPKKTMTTCEEVPVQINEPPGVACGEDDELPGYTFQESFHQRRNDSSDTHKRSVDMRHQAKTSATGRRRNVPRESSNKESVWRNQEESAAKDHDAKKNWQPPTNRRRQMNTEQLHAATWKEREEPTTKENEDTKRSWQAPTNRRRQRNAEQLTTGGASAALEERPVVELFSKAPNRKSPTPLSQDISTNKRHTKNTHIEGYSSKSGDQTTGPLRDSTTAETKNEFHRHPRRVKYRSRRYELPTVASQMKQAGMRYYYDNGNTSNIPFVVSKSTAPSHNIGVNIQQAPSLDNREINVIRLGRRLLRLPSYRYMSYNRLLALYREGDGMVPRFLRAISRPHYFYTSMYNLATNREDADGATSKGLGGGLETKRTLAEYASLYREYVQLDKCINDGNHDPELERRREELVKELAARDDHIRRVVEEYRSDGDQVTLRASASTADEAYRHSTFKLNLGDPPQ
ncbi:unnamed protein product [Diatraea saccharalis]|uniref:Uncharacterized protein n=1 Tax=Diatraea saccharalis TaxID=40085 RepID=A0A9N9N450_9NEOP|nr:unnamed protein product [Diatraea saccharalis]